MSELKELLIHQNASIKQAVEQIDKGAHGIVLIVDENKKLLGTITDGDVRRGLLKGLNMQHNVAEIMNKSPIALFSQQERTHVHALMKQKGVDCIPILNPLNEVIGIETRDEYIGSVATLPNKVVLMAGGLGTRLHPLTHETPKPLLPVGERPLLENIIENFKRFGLKDFYISINYRGDMIRDYFKSGEELGVNISYLEEEEKLGTAGALSLLPEPPKEPIIVMNGDILTSVNFQQLLAFHDFHQSKATMCVREFNVQVPYGVVETQDHRLQSIKEKPSYPFFVNAGIYVINPDVLKFVPNNSYYDMPSFFNKLMEESEMVSVFPLREYWVDIGQMDDLKRARSEFSSVFSNIC